MERWPGTVCLALQDFRMARLPATDFKPASTSSTSRDIASRIASHRAWKSSIRVNVKAISARMHTVFGRQFRHRTLALQGHQRHAALNAASWFLRFFMF